MTGVLAVLVHIKQLGKWHCLRNRPKIPCWLVLQKDASKHHHAQTGMGSGLGLTQMWRQAGHSNKKCCSSSTTVPWQVWHKVWLLWIETVKLLKVTSVNLQCMTLVLASETRKSSPICVALASDFVKIISNLMLRFKLLCFCKLLCPTACCTYTQRDLWKPFLFCVNHCCDI